MWKKTKQEHSCTVSCWNISQGASTWRKPVFASASVLAAEKRDTVLGGYMWCIIWVEPCIYMHGASLVGLFHISNSPLSVTVVYISVCLWCRIWLMEGIAVALICTCLFLTDALTLRVSQQPSQWWCLCLVEPGHQGTKACMEPCVLSWSSVWMCWFVVPTTHSTHRLVYKLQDYFFSDTVCTVLFYAKHLPIIYWHIAMSTMTALYYFLWSPVWSFGMPVWHLFFKNELVF